MIALWMLWTAGFTLLLTCIGFAMERLVALGARPRRLVWMVTLAASAATPPVLAVARSAAPAPHDGASIVRIETRTVDVGQRVQGDQHTPAVGALTPEPAPAPSGRPILPADSMMLTGWLLASAMLLLHGVVTLATLHRLRTRWPVTQVDGESVLVAPDFGPAVVGVRHPQIVLPTWALCL